MEVKSYKDLIVWQKTMGLVAFVYEITRNFPKEELYGLVSQMRRCAISILSNIAEGRGKQSSKEFVRFLDIAYGSASELETQVLISQRIGYLDQSIVESICSKITEISKMLHSMKVSVTEKAA